MPHIRVEHIPTTDRLLSTGCIRCRYIHLVYVVVSLWSQAHLVKQINYIWAPFTTDVGMKWNYLCLFFFMDGEYIVRVDNSECHITEAAKFTLTIPLKIRIYLRSAQFTCVGRRVHTSGFDYEKMWDWTAYQCCWQVFSCESPFIWSHCILWRGQVESLEFDASES